MAIRQYIGARYVPRFMGTYDATQQYEALDVVDNGLGTSYIAKNIVPVGTPLTDTTHWAIYGASSGAIINLQNQIDDMNDGSVSGSLQNQINAIDDNLKVLNGSILVIGNSYVQRNVSSKLESLFAHSYRKVYGGSGFVARTSNPTTFEDLIDLAIADASIDKSEITDIIFVSAMGDSYGVTEQGQSTYKTNLASAFNSLSTKLASNFVNCKHIMVTLAESRNAVYFSDDRYDAVFYVHKLFKELCFQYNMHYIGWTGWNTFFTGAANFEIDNYHPSAAGAELIGQDILNAYFGALEYITKRCSEIVNLNLTSDGSMTVNVEITPDNETIQCRVGNITAGAQAITVGTVLIETYDLSIPPIVPFDVSSIYVQSDVNTLGGTNTITRVTCTFDVMPTSGIGAFKLSNVTGGETIGASQVMLPGFCNLSFNF